MRLPLATTKPHFILYTSMVLFGAYALVRHIHEGYYPVVTQLDVAKYEYWLAAANFTLAGAVAMLGWAVWGWRHYWNEPGRPWLTSAITVGVVCSCGYSWANQVMSPMTAVYDPVRVSALTLALALALAEEMGIRGLLYGAAERLWGSGWAIAWSAMLFTMLHLDQRICAASPRTALGGLALSMARAKGLSLGNLIVIHFAAEAAWALFLPMPQPLDAQREAISACINLLFCVVLWRLPSPKKPLKLAHS
jgi:membrane protease YdiL (CAAX protease family)